MANEEEVRRLVGCLNCLADAYAIYDRALFYYDPALDPEKETSGKRVKTNLTYKAHLDSILPESKVPSEKYAQYLKETAYLIGTEIPGVYSEAIKALVIRYEHNASLHAKYLRPILTRPIGSSLLYSSSFWSRLVPFRLQVWLFLRQLRAPIVDRNPGKAGAITRQHVENSKLMAANLAKQFQEQAASNIWNPYTVEFGVLRDMCKLVMDEINFLNHRVNELQQRSNQRIGVALTLIGLAIGFYGIAAGWFSDKDRAAAAATENLATEIRKLAEHPRQDAPIPPKMVTPPEPVKIEFHVPRITPEKEPKS